MPGDSHSQYPVPVNEHIMPRTVAGERPRILLVEDDPGVRRSLQMLLHARGYDVRAHGSVATLLADPVLKTASCLIADYRLGDGDGFALLRALRQRGWLGPAIMITGHGSPEIASRALAAGFSCVIDKPLRDDFLASTLARLIAL